jgi:hypothetical protein
MTLKRMFFIMFLFITITTFASPPEYTIIGEYQIVSGLDGLEGSSASISKNEIFVYKDGKQSITYKYIEKRINKEYTQIVITFPEYWVYEVIFFINGSIDSYFMELRGEKRSILLRRVP